MIRINKDFSSSWSWDQDKLFEQALVMFADNEESPDRWEKIAAELPGKSAMEVKKHYEDLEHDVMEIESGRVKLPSYKGELESASWANESGESKGKKERESERRKGVPWTEEEHRYGKGDWRSISRNAVVSRTPTQVASHAQKYFLRLNSVDKKEKKRSSIHDITMEDGNSMNQSNDPNWAGTMDQSEFFIERGMSFGNNNRGFQFPSF